jgi:hypothetical protein
MKMTQTVLAAAGLALAAGSANAQFSGPYAPGNWVHNPGGGDGTAVNDGSTLVMTSNDNGLPGINNDYTIAAVASGNFAFDWGTTTVDTGTWDSAGYLINGAYTVLAFNNTSPGGGSVSVPVNAGDIIGFRCFSADGALGRITLTVTNFSGPIPAPASLALLGLGGLVAGRRRR